MCACTYMFECVCMHMYKYTCTVCVYMHTYVHTVCTCTCVCECVSVCSERDAIAHLMVIRLLVYIGGLSAVGEVAGRYGAGCGSGEGGPSGWGQLRELIVSLLGNP